MRKIYILGVGLNVLNKTELKRSIAFLLKRRRGHIVTPNPEFLLLAQKNQKFFSVLNRADLAIPDGIGLKFAAWLKGINLKRYAGSNIVSFLLRLASLKHLRIAIINWQGGLSSNDDIIKAVKKLYPHLRLFVISNNREQPKIDIAQLRDFQPDIVFVTFGAPWQDVFIRYHLLKMVPNLGIAMGVGGSFDFITGKIRRAPQIMQTLGLEWFWRLLMQPWRIKRIWNAVVIFSFTTLLWQIRRFKYRPNVVGMIINQFNEVLILNRSGKGNYWGLPQGGINFRELPEQAVKREMFEETGLKNLQVIGRFDNISSYIWPKYYTNSGYKGQKQTLFILRYFGDKRKVKVDYIEHKNYKWVKIEDFINSVSPVHRSNYELFLKKYRSIKKQHEKT